VLHPLAASVLRGGHLGIRRQASHRRAAHEGEQQQRDSDRAEPIHARIVHRWLEMRVARRCPCGSD